MCIRDRASSGGSSCWEVWAAAFCFFPCSHGPCGRFGTSGWTGGCLLYTSLADKICNLRVFEDESEKMNLNLEQVGGSLLVVSQFTLYADTSSRRPGFSGAAKPDLAIPLYERFMAHCRERGFDVQHGEFGADMQVYSCLLYTSKPGRSQR